MRALAGRHEDEHGVRLGVAGALQERREIRIGERRADELRNFAAALEEGLLEEILRIDAGSEIRHHADHPLDTVLERPLRHDDAGLREREAGAHHIGRALGDARGAGRHHNLRDFCLGGERRHRKRRRRQPEADDEIHLLVDDEFLRQPLGIVRDGAVVLDDDLDFLARHGVAVLRHIETHRGANLHAGRLLRPRHRQQRADLDGGLCLGRCGGEAEHGGCSGGEDDVAKHGGFLRVTALFASWEASSESE